MLRPVASGQPEGQLKRPVASGQPEGQLKRPVSGGKLVPLLSMHQKQIKLYGIRICFSLL